MIIEVGIAPCDKCGRELITDQYLAPGAWYFGSCDEINGDGCKGEADTDKGFTTEMEIH
jgi:hypothetical protein